MIPHDSGILKAKRGWENYANVWRFVFELFDNGTKKMYAMDVTEGNAFTAFKVS